MSRKPVVLVVMDGWGVGEPRAENAVWSAKTPVIDELTASYPHSQLLAHGPHVGLPEGQLGGSEVGHLHLGSGRLVYQDLAYIDRQIETGAFFSNETLLQAFRLAKQRGTRLHLIGLVSDGGIHSHQRHLDALFQLAEREGLENVAIHALLDGRDTPPRSGRGYVAYVEEQLQAHPVGRIASISGRYYGMDRDNRWERVGRYLNMIVNGEGPTATAAVGAVEQAYAAGETDEFVSPVLITDDGQLTLIQNGDVVLFFNFRADRVRQMILALTQQDLATVAAQRAAAQLKPKQMDNLKSFVASWTRPEVSVFCTTRYFRDIDLPVVFEPERSGLCAGLLIAEAGLRQIRLAETEKYPHVTYFFSGGQEVDLPGERKILINSPTDVPTYDHKPEMSAHGVCGEAIKAIESEAFDFMLVNFANGDMVGHTGIQEAARKAVETVDACVGRLVEALLKQGGVALVTADHGNCEQMVDYETGEPHTAHTLNPVPIIFVGQRFKQIDRKPDDGILSNVTTTVLELLEIPVPEAMDCKPLI